MYVTDLVPLPEKLGSVLSSARSILLGAKDISPYELAQMRKLVTDSGYALSNRPKGFVNSAKGLLFGASTDPLGVLKARARRGGIFGRGGIIRGDIAMDPAMLKTWDKIRKGDHSFGNYLGLAGHGLGYTAGVAFGPGLTAAALAGAAMGSSTIGDVGAEGTTLLGYSLGAPFGMTGGIMGSLAGSALGDGLRSEELTPQDKMIRRAGGAASGGLTHAVKAFQPFEVPEPEIYLPSETY